MMYNPINMEVEDDKRLQEYDQREKNKKARYGVRYDADASTRAEMIAEQERLDKMALSKVSYKRIAEEHGRGFDILTNDKLQGGLAKVDATQYMKNAPKIWDHIQAKTTDNGFGVTATNATPLADASGLDFHATRFETRSRRLNTNMARTNPDQSAAAAVASQSNKASEAKASDLERASERPPRS